MLTYLIPTRDRTESLARTLRQIESLSAAAHERIGGAEVIVVDDCSTVPVCAPSCLINGFALRVLRTDRIMGAAARNVGALEARGEWIIMLDDDSWPIDDGLIEVIAGADDDVAAIGGEIVLPDGRREDGGLPEVIVGCGAALRRSTFLDVGGYDDDFHYYAEEYDLCAKLIRGGWRIEHDFRMKFHHAKIAQGRDMSAILRRLVRNNGWVAARYAPMTERGGEVERVIERCALIAEREHARFGFEQGLDDLMRTIDAQQDRAMSECEWNRFTGRTAAERDLVPELSAAKVPLAIVAAGRNEWVVREVLAANGCQTTQQDRSAAGLVIGTLSPGPMLNALASLRSESRLVLMPWQPAGMCERTCV